MWQGTGSTNKWNLSCCSPSLGSFVWFSLICSRRGGARQRQQRHLIPLPTRAGRRWQMVWQGPRLGFVAETGRSLAMETPRVRLSCILICRASYFSFSILLPFPPFSLHPGTLIFVSLRLCSNLLLSASTYFIVRVLSCVICTLPHLVILLFFFRIAFFFVVDLISRVAFFLLCSRTRYAST